MLAREMIGAHPNVGRTINDSLVRCIEECHSCAQACLACADSCLAEKDVDVLRQCIRMNLDCADICAMTAATASRRTGANEHVLRQAIELCALACRECGAECESHASLHAHCRICADVCMRCEAACREATASIH